jgi:transcriptional regulator with XRE-family HTH domain
MHLIRWYQFFCVYLRSNIEQFMANTKKNEALNRLRVVLAEQDKTNRWLAEQLGKTEHTISRWCHNKSQPSVAQLNEIANVLNVDVRMLIISTK